VTSGGCPHRIERIRWDHRRDALNCGAPELDQYLQKYARQNDVSDLARAYVAVVADEPLRVIGYYTLSAAQVDFEALPPEHRRKQPKYPIPATRIGRLAVDQSFQNAGLGSMLLFDAFRRVSTVSAEIGIKAVIVDARDDQAKGFYRHFGFIELLNTPLALFLPIETVRRAITGF
jgi:GNAT superfamily N-acetyltransferase